MLARLFSTALCALLCACSSLTALSPAPQDGSAWDDELQDEADEPGERALGIEGTNVRMGAEFGQRNLANSRWDQLGSPSVFGFTGSHEPPEWPVGLDLGLYRASDTGRLGVTRMDMVTWEGFAGVMKTLHLLDGRLLVHGGAGAALSYLATDPDDPLLSQQDATWTSGYARVGVTVQISPEFEFGLGWRSARGGSFNVAGVELDGDYDQFGFTLSASW